MVTADAWLTVYWPLALALIALVLFAVPRIHRGA
jgi:hypothetical protein